MSSPRHFLVELIKSNKIEQEHTAKAISLLALIPSSSQWYLFANTLLLVLGSLALVCSVVFFIAYNWVDMGRFVKFALVQLLIVASLGWYWFSADNRSQQLSQASTKSYWSGELALLVAVILLGVLLAVHGQTYQTGADPWQLFFIWALMILPWALCARSTVLCLVLIMLANTSAGLYSEQALRFAGAWPNVILLSCALLLWELSAKRCHWLNMSWAPRIIAVLLCFLFAGLMLPKIFGFNEISLAWLVWGVWLIGMFITYRKIRLDVLILTFWCLSLIVVITSWSIYGLFKASFSLDNLLMAALLLIVQGTVASLWLKQCYKESVQ